MWADPFLGAPDLHHFRQKNAAEMTEMIIVGIKIAGLRDHLKVKC